MKMDGEIDAEVLRVLNSEVLNSKVIRGSLLTEDYIKSVVGQLDHKGRGLAEIARTWTGASAIGYMLQCIQYYNDASKGIGALGLVQEFKKMLELLDESGCRMVSYEEMNGLIITASDLVYNQPYLNASIHQRATGNLGILFYHIWTRMGHKGLKSPQQRGLRFSYDISKSPPSDEEQPMARLSEKLKKGKKSIRKLVSRVLHSCSLSGCVPRFRK